jgi:hypothetical protein
MAKVMSSIRGIVSKSLSLYSSVRCSHRISRHTQLTLCPDSTIYLCRTSDSVLPRAFKRTTSAAKAQAISYRPANEPCTIEVSAIFVDGLGARRY